VEQGDAGETHQHERREGKRPRQRLEAAARDGDRYEGACGYAKPQRAAIVDGRLQSGLRLPPTRLLAERLGVSRNTVVAAYERLLSEGYVIARVGSGTYVAEELPILGPRQCRSGFPKMTDALRRSGASIVCLRLCCRPHPAASTFVPGSQT
jgi:biotin operon repressor